MSTQVVNVYFRNELAQNVSLLSAVDYDRHIHILTQDQDLDILQHHIDHNLASVQTNLAGLNAALAYIEANLGVVKAVSESIEVQGRPAGTSVSDRSYNVTIEVVPH